MLKGLWRILKNRKKRLNRKKENKDLNEMIDDQIATFIL